MFLWGKAQPPKYEKALRIVILLDKGMYEVESGPRNTGMNQCIKDIIGMLLHVCQTCQQWGAFRGSQARKIMCE